MNDAVISEIRAGFETAYIDESKPSAMAYRPSFVSNNQEEGKKVLASIEDELMACDQFQISVAFITMGGIIPLLQTLKELEKRGVPGQILTTNYLSFSEPTALEKLHNLKNITLKMYDVNAAEEGFHTKGYIFRQDEVYRIIIGSSNMTSAALTSNREWNTRVVSTEQGEMAQQILAEYHTLWDSPYALDYDTFIEGYRQQYEIARKQKEVAKQNHVVELDRYRLQPNSMQTGFIKNLKGIIEAGEERALLISATGTGKTYASAFAMRELGFKRVLFLVHRGQLALQTKKSYEKVFGNTVSMGLVGSGYHEYDKDYVFATIQTLNKEAHIEKYAPDEFDCIILDEAHHSSADTYQKVMEYFHPKLWLGMTATPDKREDGKTGRNIYEIFHYQIAYEIRLQQAMEEKMLCPFHYFGISDLAMIGDEIHKEKKLSVDNFNRLVSDERVHHILTQAEYYGYSGSRVKGLVFCSSIAESKELSNRFNLLERKNEQGEVIGHYRTIALNGDASAEERAEAFERLAMGESEATEELQPLDYIFSVDILNEGVDIVEVNQIIMLRPTESPIIFIQQLGRGLRKADGKEFVVILDFIGNYEKNFMIPVALSGDRSYNADTIRKYVISGNRVIPGASTVHFDAVAKEKIFHAIDKIRGMKGLIRESYYRLKERLGRVPYMMDFYENKEVDPLVIVNEYKTYQDLLVKVEGKEFGEHLTDLEKLTIEYLSKTILSGVRPYELEILDRINQGRSFSKKELTAVMREKYKGILAPGDIDAAILVLTGHFVTKDEEYKKYRVIDILEEDDGVIRSTASYQKRLKNPEFLRQVEDIVSVGLRRNREKYAKPVEKSPFTLYEKYSRRDVCLLMNSERDLASVMYGMKRIDEDAFVFVTYHKEEAKDEALQYAEGKPDYADEFADSTTFRWDSKIGMGPDSGYMQDVVGAKRRHLLVKKSDAESSFYYMGQFDVVRTEASTKVDNSGKEKIITKVTMKMHHPAREDLLKYLESSMIEVEEKIG